MYTPRQLSDTQPEGDDDMELHEKLKAAIEESGLKNNYIAAKIGVSESVLSSILSGRRRIYATEFFGICELLGKSPSKMIKDPAA